MNNIPLISRVTDLIRPLLTKLKISESTDNNRIREAVVPHATYAISLIIVKASNIVFDLTPLSGLVTPQPFPFWIPFFYGDCTGLNANCVAAIKRLRELVAGSDITEIFSQSEENLPRLYTVLGLMREIIELCDENVLAGLGLDGTAVIFLVLTLIIFPICLYSFFMYS